jgi:hypothetical protein
MIYDLKAGRLSRFAPSGLRRPDVQTNPIRPGLGRARFQVDERCETKPIARSGAPRCCPAGPGGTGPPGRGTQGNRAKQTQFRRRAKQRQVLGRKGVMVNSTSDRPRQNKANSRGWDAPGGTTSGAVAQAYRAKQTQFAADGQGRPLPRPEALTMPPTGDKRAKQSQFPATAGWGEARGAWGDGANAQNEPNSGGAGRPSLAPAKPIVRHPLDAPLRATNQNLGELGYLGGQDGGDERRANASNKPNSSITDCGSGTDLRRDALCGSPGQRPVVQANPIGRSQSCETNPIARSGAPRRCPAGPAGRGLGRRGAAAIVQNEPNLRSSGRPDGPGTRHRMAATPRRRRNLIDSRRRALYYRFPASRSACPARYPVRPRGAKRTTPNA